MTKVTMVACLKCHLFNSTPKEWSEPYPSHSAQSKTRVSLLRLWMNSYWRLSRRHFMNFRERQLKVHDVHWSTTESIEIKLFSTALRILFEHTMAELAPPELVEKTLWFSVERKDGSPTRSQRIAYAIQGGLTEASIMSELGVEVAPLRKRLLNAVDELSKQVHGRQETIVDDSAEQDASARAALNALETFFETFHACRSAILEPIRDELDDAAISALISETILEVDEIASHHLGR